MTMALEPRLSLPTKKTPAGRRRFNLAMRNACDYVQDVPYRTVSTVTVALDRALGLAVSDRAGILAYHRTVPWPRGLPAPWQNVQPRQFRRQIEGLLAQGFRFWPLKKLLEYRARGQSTGPGIAVLTFDDGFQSFFRYAFPILKELRVPATLFVATRFLDNRDPFPFDEWGVRYRNVAPAISYRPVTTAQCREMADSGVVELAAHTHTHSDFRGKPEAFRRNLEHSLQVLRQRFGLHEASFAFPFGCPHQGYADEALREAARQTGVLCGLTTEANSVNIQSDPIGWGRFPVFPWDTAATLSAKLHGWYSWAPRLRRRAKKLMGLVPLRASRVKSKATEKTGWLSWLTGNRAAHAKAS